MKCKTTKKAVKDNYNKIIGIGYCDAQHLLKYQDAFGYNAGAGGWNCDFYDVNGVCISTGYSYIHNQNIKSFDYDMLRSYEEKAQTIAYDYNIPWQEQKEKINNLLNEFIEAVSN